MLEVVDLLEQAIGKKAMRELLPMQPGDVPATYADVDDLMRDVGFQPSTPIEEGIARFVDWYRDCRRGGILTRLLGPFRWPPAASEDEFGSR